MRFLRSSVPCGPSACLRPDLSLVRPWGRRRARRPDLRHALAVLLTLGPLASLAASTACSSNDKMSGVANAKLPANADEGLQHESCDESGNRVETLDLNGDGKADIRRVFSKGSGVEVCRVVDLNHDGKPDLYEYFDGNGVVRRREFCY